MAADLSIEEQEVSFMGYTARNVNGPQGNKTLRVLFEHFAYWISHSLWT